MARGSISKAESGGWLLRWDGPRHPDGSRNQLQQVVRGTKKQAEAELNRIQADLARSPAERAAEMPVSELCQLFLEERGKTDIRPGTERIYRYLFQWDLLPVCGDIPLGMVDRSILQKVIQRQIDRGLDASTINALHGNLGGLFSWGVVAGYLPETPVRQLSLPEAPSKSSGKILTAPEACAVLAALEGRNSWLPTYIGLHTGMRPGEVLGLSWGDVDLVASTLSVRRTMIYESGGFRLGPPKTKTSRRVVSVSEDVVAVLRDRERSRPEVFWYRGKTIVPDGFRQLCSQADGSVLLAEPWREGFGSGLERAALPHFRLHDLRHTHASLLLLDGVPMHVVSKRLGHANIQTTIDLYGHLLPTSDPDAAASFAEILRTS